MRKGLYVLLLIALMLGLSSCNTFKDTPETEAAFDAYEAAVRQSIAHKKGSIIVETKNKDTIEKTETLGVIDYDYVTDGEDRVSFERKDYTDGALVASYYGDGSKAFQMELETEKWVDVTEDSKAMLDHNKNYMNTLSLFRIDNQFRYSKHFYESLTMTEEEGKKVIVFTLKSSAVTKMFEFSDEREIRRNMAGQTRTYYINEDGDLEKIVIDTLQDVVYKGNEGQLANTITVTMDYE